MTSITVGQILFVVLYMAPMNWLVTVLVTENKVFEDLRRAFAWAGERLEKSGKPIRSNIGSKVKFFPNCPMCVGVWVGFAQAAAFGGPLSLPTKVAFLTVVANGLLYKAWGHFVLQLSKLLHESIETRHFRLKSREPHLEAHQQSTTTNGHAPRTLVDMRS